MNPPLLACLGGEPAVTLPHPPPWPRISRAAQDRVVALMESGELADYGLGSTLAEFERTVADYHGVPFALALSSGTAALHTAFHGVGIGPGDEVIVPSYSYHATVAPLFLLSAVPVLCDNETDTGNIDLADAARRVTSRTRAVVVTHLWGHPVEADALRAFAARFGLKVVEDGSHAHGARWRDVPVGTFGDVGVFSTGPRKMVSAGMGGVLVTRDEKVIEAALRLGHSHTRAGLSLPPSEAAVGLGANYRMGTVAAAIATEQYRDLDERIATKGAVLRGLSRRLEGIPGLRPQPTAPHVTRGGWYGYKAVYVPEELGGLHISSFVRALQAEGLKVDRPSNLPLHWLEMFSTRRLEPRYYRPGAPRPLYGRGDFPGAEQYYEACVSFPARYFSDPCDDLLDQYRAGILKVVRQADRIP
ncbi:DegT/DnrJ/EryC1/StrS family aminotransferase [Streptomyces sp. NRRL F-5123]|uniref:DegT/DnrJ/EryC1/StrS family aminotransferase n=1 Tax=Streptomyces sp. NRRL F-5123 TaxID=1463856 RepID=UPI0004E1E29B|nr:DegT/DnrJ/EryC1/StrS family aminotransferase [Streptomyces sp. NRRL F-5123]